MIGFGAVRHFHTDMGQRARRFSKKRPGMMAKNVAVLGFGTAFSQLLNIISTPVLSWYYAPESFGIMATALGIVYIVGSLANTNYDSAIVITKEKEDAVDLLYLCLFLNILCCILFFFVSYLAFNTFEKFSDFSSLWFPLLLSLGVLSTSIFNTLQFYAVRIEDYAASSLSHVVRTLSCLLIQLLGTLFSATAVWLISGRVVGHLPAIGYLIGRDRASLSTQNFRQRLSRLIGAARKYRRFPIYAAPQRVIALLAEEMPTLALATFFGPGAAGYYWFSSRLLQMPCSVISHAIGRVFSRESIKKIHQGRSPFRSALKIVVALALVAMPPVAVIVIWAPQLFDFVLGSQWQTSAIYSQWIVIWVFFRFSLSPVLCLFTVLSEQKRLLKLDSVAFVIRIALIAYCAWQLDALAVVIALSVFESLKIATYGVIVLRLARTHVPRETTSLAGDNSHGTLA